MTLVLNVVTAWIAVFLAIALSVIWIFRLVIRKYALKPQGKLARVNYRLRKAHKWLGIAFVVISLIHGALSSMDVLSANKGTVMTILGILMGITFYARKRLGHPQRWIRVHRVLTVLLMLLIPAHIAEVGGIIAPEVLIGYTGGVSFAAEPIELAEQPDLTGNVYADGAYTATVQGFRPGLTVSVTMEDSEIVSVEVVSHNEVGARYYSRAIETVPDLIVQAQSLDVDTVSGATFTSTGIINGVATALNEALISGTESAITDLGTLQAERGGHGHGDRLFGEAGLPPTHEREEDGNYLQEDQESDLED